MFNLKRRRYRAGVFLFVECRNNLRKQVRGSIRVEYAFIGSVEKPPGDWSFEGARLQPRLHFFWRFTARLRSRAPLKLRASRSFATVKNDESSAQQAFWRIFHICNFIERAGFPIMQAPCHAELNDSHTKTKTTHHRSAPNPVTGLWSGCTWLHSQQLRARVFH